MSDAQLLDDWVAGLSHLAPSVDPPAARREGITLLARWDEPHRSYHTRQHLTEMLSAIDTLADATRLQPRDTCIARVAAWLHDAVYDVHVDPGGPERDSAALARKMLSSLGVASSDSHTVEQLILLTIDHGTQLPGSLADVFTDADLAILAAPPERFDEYCRQVRDEYAHVPDAAYATGRRQILEALVDRPEVYRTTHARAAWTHQANANVAREVARLRLGE
ncbi:HD domain-containing protein [Flexivirga sp. B27]